MFIFQVLMKQTPLLNNFKVSLNPIYNAKWNDLYIQFIIGTINNSLAVCEQLSNINMQYHYQFSLVAQLCLTLCDPMDAASQASLSITSSQNLLKIMSIESEMPSNHLILCHRLLLPPSIFPSIRVFSNESALHIRLARVFEFQLQH